MRSNKSAWAKSAGALALLLFSGLSLGGCESNARQDPLFVRNSTDALVFGDVGFFLDRPISESLRSALELTDYTTALDRAGLLTLLQQPGPFTVFAIPNQPLEAAQAAYGGRLLDPATIPSLRRQLGYTIVPGAYTDATLRGMMAKARGPIALRSIYGDPLTVSVEPATGQLLLSNSQGQSNRIWLSSMPQSNGVLYATQTMLSLGLNPGPSPGVPARVTR